MSDSPSAKQVNTPLAGWIRALSIFAGAILLGATGLLLRGLVHTYRQSIADRWLTLGSVASFAVIAGLLGFQLLHLGVTGRLDGRMQRWLTSIRDAITELRT